VSDPLYRDPDLRIVFAVTLMAVLGVSSITPAFPAMQKALHLTPQTTGLLITVFTLPGIVATPVLGMLSDRWGRKRILVPSLFLFALAGACVPLAASFKAMLVARFIQGLGAAALGSLNVTIIGDLYSGPRTTAAMGYNAGVLNIGTAVYPAIGGALATLGWRFPFFLPLAAIPVAISVWFRLDTHETRSDQPLRAYLAGALASVRDRRVLGLFLASLSAFVLLYGAYTTYLPFLLSDSFGGSPAVIGLVMSSMSLTTALTASQLSRLARRHSEPRLIISAFLLCALALAMIPHVPNLWLFLVPATVYGLGHGLVVPSVQAMLARMAPPQQRGAFMSLNGMVLRLGQTLGPLIMGAAYSTWGLVSVYNLGVVLAVLAAVAAAATLGTGLRQPRP